MESLFKCLELAKLLKIKLCIDAICSIYVTVDEIDIVESGCGRCNSRYDVFEVTGLITANYLQKQHSYTSIVSTGLMVKCDCENDPSISLESTDVFFKGTIDSTKDCVCHRYVSLEWLENQLYVDPSINLIRHRS